MSAINLEEILSDMDKESDSFWEELDELMDNILTLEKNINDLQQNFIEVLHPHLKEK